VTALVVLLAIAVGLLAALVVGLLRSHAEILRALHDLGVGDDGATTRPRGGASGRTTRPLRTADGVPEPRDDLFGVGHDISGIHPDGTAVHVAITGVEHATLIAFLSTGCMTCGRFWEALDDPAALQGLGRDVRVVIATEGPDAESESTVRALAPRHVTTVMSTAAWRDYDVQATPFFVLVDGVRGAIIGEGSGGTWAQVVDLLGQSRDDQAAAIARTSRREVLGGRQRKERADRALADAGIEPGDPALFHEREPVASREPTSREPTPREPRS
jgi:hypothetical protein